MADRNDEEILRAILEKGSDKAKQQAAAAIAQQPPTPADPPVVKEQKKKRKGLSKVAGALGKQKFYYGPGGTIVDKEGVPAPPRIAEMLVSKDAMADRVRDAVPKITVSPAKLNAVNSELRKIISGTNAIARSHDKVLQKMPELFGQIDLAMRNLIEKHHLIVEQLVKQNEELQDKVIEALTGARAPTRAGGAVSKPKRGSAARAVGASRAAGRRPKLRETNLKAVMERRERILQAREDRNRRSIKKMAIVGAIGGLAAGAAYRAITGGGAGGGGGAAPPPGPAAPGPTGTEPSPSAQRSSVPGMVELTTPISKKKFVVAEQYANNFKGFVDELENSGYTIKSIGGYANRNIAGTGQKSFHSLGVAIDINPSTNPHVFPPKGLVTDMPSNVAQMAAKYGLGWGGNWRSSKDAMHFSMASAEGGSVRIDRSGVAPLPGAPAAPAPTAGAAAPGAMTPAPAAPPPGVPARAMAPSPGTPGAPSPGGNPSVKEVAQYIISKAQAMGVNPNMALGIAAYEGLNPNTIGAATFGNRDARGYSFGPYQLYSGSPDPTKIAPGGMAAEFMQRYKQPPSAANWRQQVDFSLELMKRRGPAGLERGPWYAVRDRGGVANITRLGSQYAAQQGIRPGEITAAPTAAAPPAAAGPTSPPEAGTAPPGVPERAMAPSPGTPNAPGAPTQQGGGGNVREAQSGIRKLPISDKLRSVLQQAARAAGVDVVVTSGGQPGYPKGPRTGSTRHDHGNAADLDLYVGGKILTDANPQHVELKKKFVAAAAAGGASGIGAGYMGPTKIHVGFGTKATWGGAAWLRGISPGSGAADVQVAGAPSGATTAGGAVTQGRSVSEASSRQAMAETMVQRGPQLVVMNNNRTMMHTRTVHRGGSLQNMQRPNTGEFNPFDVVATVATGFAMGRAMRLF